MAHAHNLHGWRARHNPQEQMTRVQYLRKKILLDDCWDCPKALVDATIAWLCRVHPEWDLNEIKTWAQWEHPNNRH
jgi:hypothetical protein